MPFSRLTPRQRVVTDLLLSGLTVVAVARLLGITIGTARAHTHTIAQRLANPHGLPAVKLIMSYAPARRAAERAQAAPSPTAPNRSIRGF